MAKVYTGACPPCPWRQSDPLDSNVENLSPLQRIIKIFILLNYVYLSCLLLIFLYNVIICRIFSFGRFFLTNCLQKLRAYTNIRELEPNDSGSSDSLALQADSNDSKSFKPNQGIASNSDHESKVALKEAEVLDADRDHAEDRILQSCINEVVTFWSREILPEATGHESEIAYESEDSSGALNCSRTFTLTQPKDENFFCQDRKTPRNNMFESEFSLATNGSETDAPCEIFLCSFSDLEDFN